MAADRALPFNVNNFDLLRLLAATQVAVHHVLTHALPGQSTGVLEALQFLPGVPVFFFLSGFLVSRSYESSPALGDYVRNRVLRLFPGLAVCVLGSLLIVAVTGYLATVPVSVAGVVTWLASQLTVFQFYNPEFLRGFGVGVLNGSLWTISVEVQFYVLVPLLYAFLGRLGSGYRTGMLVALTAAFAGVNLLYRTWLTAHGDVLAVKLLGVSFLPWFYMFLLGVLCQQNFDRLQRWLEGRAGLLGMAYLGVALAGHAGLGWQMGNLIPPPALLLLALAVLAAAFTQRTLSEHLLGRNDISYGIYIWHMPLINLGLHLGWAGSASGALGLLGLTACAALLSWRLVERPALRRKRRALHAH